jgi:hypothetical protein
MAGLNLFTNNAATTLASGVLIADTSLTVAAGTGAEFPTLTGSEYFYCTLANNAGSIEIIKVTARSTDTFTIVRGQDGTSAAAWSAGDKVELRLTRIDLLNFPQLDSTNTFATTQTFTAAPVFTDQSGTRTAMTAAKSGANSDITSLTGLTTALSVAQGGSGQTTYTDGQLLIGNTTGNTLTKATLTAGTGISVTNGSGAITIASTAAGGFSNMTVATTPGSFTTPASTTKIKVTVVGAGGSGGSGGSTPGPLGPTPTGIGSGGGGGGAAIKILTVSASTPYPYTIGTAPGGTSSFGPVGGTTVSATGGANAAASGGAAGAGGLGASGDINIRGGGGGGASPRGGNGGSSILGGGGAPPGGVGGQYGGGGSGSSAVGFAGVIIIEY